MRNPYFIFEKFWDVICGKKDVSISYHITCSISTSFRFWNATKQVFVSKVFPSFEWISFLSLSMSISKKADIFDFLVKYSPRSNSCQIAKITSDQKELRKDIIRISRFLNDFRYSLKKANFHFSNPHSFNTSQNISSNIKFINKQCKKN